MHKRPNRDESSERTSVFKRWCVEAQRRASDNFVEKTKNTEVDSVPVLVPDAGGRSSSDNDGNSIADSEVSGDDGLDEEQYVERHNPGRGPFDFLRHIIPDYHERVSDRSVIGDNIFDLSAGGHRNRNTPEEVDEFENTSSLGGNDDLEPLSDDETVPTPAGEYEDTLDRLGRSLAAEFVSGIHRYVSRVIVPSGAGGVQACLLELDRLIERYPPGHFYIVAEHNDHVHVSHVCGYSGNTCRCSFIVRGTFWAKHGRRGLRRVSRAIDFRPIDWRNILRYLSAGGRRIHSIGGVGKDGRLFNRYKYISTQRHLGQAQRGLLDGSNSEMQRDVPCEPQGRDVNVKGSEDAGVENGQIKKHKKNQKESGVRSEDGPLTIPDLLHQYPCCPPEAYKNIKEYYLNSNLNYLCAKDKYVDRDLELWGIKLMHWSLRDYENYYKDEKVHPYFNAYNRTFDQVYYNVTDSVRIANELLLYQFDNNTENVYCFLIDLINVLDKRVPKCNTLAILAPPNAGKNYFFDAVASFFLNYGCLGTANKTNNFAFMEAAGKRLVLWNEPNYESQHVNELKALLGGDSCRVSVKYKSDQALQGPPIIILTNDNLSIFGMSAFQPRIKLYNWQSAPFLRNYDKKINPMFILDLFKMYNIS